MTFLTDRQFAQNLVARGDVALQMHDAHWTDKVTKPVDVANEALNPLGQIFGNPDQGLRILGLTVSQAGECGFMPCATTQTSDLNDLWNAHVLSRALSSPSNSTHTPQPNSPVIALVET